MLSDWLYRVHVSILIHTDVAHDATEVLTDVGHADTLHKELDWLASCVKDFVTF